MNGTLAMAKIRADLDRHRHLFDLDRDGLGRDLCKAFTDGVQGCIADQKSPDGSPWPPLSEAYAEWKSYQFPGNPMAVLYQTMADPHQVAGEVAVSILEASVEYGTTEQARQEAVWFQEGNSRGQPPRPFWGFTPDSLDEVKRILDARFATA